MLVLSASKTEDKDNLWLVDPDLFPFQNTLMESHVSLVYPTVVKKKNTHKLHLHVCKYIQP